MYCGEWASAWSASGYGICSNARFASGGAWFTCGRACCCEHAPCRSERWSLIGCWTSFGRSDTQQLAAMSESNKDTLSERKRKTRKNARTKTRPSGVFFRKTRVFSNPGCLRSRSESCTSTGQDSNPGLSEDRQPDHCFINWANRHPLLGEFTSAIHVHVFEGYHPETAFSHCP